MPYTHLDYGNIQDARLMEVFKHTDMYLHDAYAMFRLPPPDRDGGGGNFAIALVLLCIIDGLAAEVWPGRTQEDDQKKRFKQLIRDRLRWGPEGKGKWLDKGNAAKQMYTEFRNPLVHELAGNQASRPPKPGYVEAVIGKWGALPSELHDIEKIDALAEWNDAWPIVSDMRDPQGRARPALALSGLYWAVKRIAVEMIAEAKAIAPP